MRWRHETKEQRENRLSQWHPFFCLRPRVVGEYTYWLQTIYRRIIPESRTILAGGYPMYTYREVEYSISIIEAMLHEEG